MCDSCGCGNSHNIKISKPGDRKEHHGSSHNHDKPHHSHTHDDKHHHHKHNDVHNHHHHHHPHDNHTHSHNHDGHTHEHPHAHHHAEVNITIEQNLLHQNNLLAQRNRGYFEAKNIKAYNLVSSPGSGKTSLLERTIKDLKDKINLYVIEGDQQTLNDANRIDAAGAPVIQINTGNGCHLDADMVFKAVKELNPAENSILMIENVGNLVCPALFDLGETKRIVIISVTEGEDKPVKYPTMFHSAHLCVINKTDLLPYVDFSVEKARQYALQVNPALEFIEVSVKTGVGITDWYKWIQR